MLSVKEQERLTQLRKKEDLTAEESQEIEDLVARDSGEEMLEEESELPEDEE